MATVYTCSGKTTSKNTEKEGFLKGHEKGREETLLSINYLFGHEYSGW